MATTTPQAAHRLPAGLAAAAVGTGCAIAAQTLLPLLTGAILAGAIAANAGLLPAATRPGLAFAAKRLMRVGVVLLGLQVSLSDIAGLGWRTVALTLGVLVTTLLGTRRLGRAMGLPDRLATLVAAGFAICGASAVAAVDTALGGDGEGEDAVTATALVALCGSLAIAVLPLAGHLLGLDPYDFGRWTGASVHDVGQVVATASVVGPAALAPALAVKLIRVAMLAPVAAGFALRGRGRGRTAAPLLPLFVAGFLVAVLVRTAGVLPGGVLDVAGVAQQGLFAFALFGLGSLVDVRRLLGTGRRALALGFASWALIAITSYVGVRLL